MRRTKFVPTLEVMPIKAAPSSMMLGATGTEYPTITVAEYKDTDPTYLWPPDNFYD
jgi:hypothetical protein